MTGRRRAGEEESTAGEENYTRVGKEQSGATHKHLNLAHQSIDGTFSELI